MQLSLLKSSKSEAEVNNKTNGCFVRYLAVSLELVKGAIVGYRLG